MTVWLIRAGREGEREDFDFQYGLAVIGWSHLPDLSTITDRQQLKELLDKHYPDRPEQARINWEGQLWEFVKEMKIGDWVATPLKHRPMVAIGKIIGKYKHEPDYPVRFQHTLPVEWITEIPRNRFAPDLITSLNSRKTISRIYKNYAEERIVALVSKY